MKKSLIALMAFFSLTSAIAQKKIADVATLNTETFNFGKVKQNVPATATFVVTNISSEPLIIETANPTCGCTISDYTKSPIAPGKTGTIKATFNAANLGAIHKALTVKFAGIEELKPINLAGEVLESGAYDKWLASNKGGVKAKESVNVKSEAKVEGDKNAKKVAQKKVEKVAARS